MKIELSRFRVRQDAHEIAREWLDFLNQHKEEVLLTLNDEKIKVEMIFEDKIKEELYLIWVTIFHEGGSDVQQSSHWVDQQHLKYWSRCIDKSYVSDDLKPTVVLFDKQVEEIVKKK